MPSPTPMDQQIMDAIAKQSSIGSDIKARYTNQPTFEANTRATVFGQDKPLNDLMGGFSDKVAELFKYDQSKNAQYSAPVTTQGGESMMVNPMIQATADRTFFNKAVDDKETAWKLYETRKNLLGDVMDKAVKAYEAETQGMKVEADSLNAEIGKLMDMFKETNRQTEFGKELSFKEKELKSKSGGGTTGVPDIDNLRDADAVAAVSSLGIDLTGTTAAERGAKAKDILAEYAKTGKVETRRYLDQLDKVRADKVAGLTDVFRKANELVPVLKTKQVSGPIVGRTSQWLSDLLGVKSDATFWGKALEELSADKIKERYGGALTATEVQRLTRQATTSRNVSENSNIDSVNYMAQNAVELIKETLKNSGLPQAAIDQYIKEIGADATSTRPPLEDLFK